MVGAIDGMSTNVKSWDKDASSRKSECLQTSLYRCRASPWRKQGRVRKDGNSQEDEKSNGHAVGARRGLLFRTDAQAAQGPASKHRICQHGFGPRAPVTPPPKGTTTKAGQPTVLIPRRVVRRSLGKLGPPRICAVFALVVSCGTSPPVVVTGRPDPVTRRSQSHSSPGRKCRQLHRCTSNSSGA